MIRLPTSAEFRHYSDQGRRQAAAAIRRRPPVVTLAFIIVIAVTWARLEVGGQLPVARFIESGFSARAVIDGRFSTLLTSTLLCRDIFMVISICISLLVTMGTYEVVAGHLRATCLAVFAAAVGPLSVFTGLGLLYLLGSTWAQGRLETLDIGASAIVAASSGALAAIARSRLLTLGLVLFLLGGLLVHHQLADWEHVLIFPWGFLAGRIFGVAVPRRRRSAPWTRFRAAGHGIAVLLLAAVGLAGCARVLPGNPTYRSSATGQVVSAPRIVQTSYPTPSMGGSRSVLVLLPAGYDSTPTRRYPVIELLHGDPGSPAGMVNAGAIEQAQSSPQVAPFIGIAPDGNDATKPFSWWANIPGHAMGTAVTTDLRAWAATHFRLDGLWSYAGLSSGGFGAAYLPLLSTAPVHAVCALSGFFDGHIPVTVKRGAKAEQAVSADAHAVDEPSLVFVAYGTTDKGTRAQSLGFIAALHKVHKNAVLRTYPGGHVWPVWRQAFQACFEVVSPATHS